MNGRPDSPALTAEQFLAQGGGFRELVHGVIREVPPGSYEHGWICARIATVLADFVKAHGLGDVLGAGTGFILERNPDTVRAADVAFVRRDRRPKEVRRFAEILPDLVVEVVSPSDHWSEVAEKAALWLEAGTAEVWLIDPRRRTVERHRLDAPMQLLRAADVVEGGQLLPGFSVPVRELFPPRS